MVTDIKLGKRPSRPTDPSQNQWLQDPVWDAIATCWSGQPEQRPKLSAVYRMLLKDGLGEVRNVEPDNLNSEDILYSLNEATAFWPMEDS